MELIPFTKLKAKIFIDQSLDDSINWDLSKLVPHSISNNSISFAALSDHQLNSIESIRLFLKVAGKWSQHNLCITSLEGEIQGADGKKWSRVSFETDRSDEVIRRELRFARC